MLRKERKHIKHLIKTMKGKKKRGRGIRTKNKENEYGKY